MVPVTGPPRPDPEPPGRPALIVLWSPPRCRSTAFLRVMLERGDLAVVHEPFSHRAMQGRIEVDGVDCRTDADVLTALLELARRQPVFVKETTDYDYPGLLADPRLAAARHTFLIRDPAEAIASHHAMNPALTLAEVGFERCAAIFDLAVRLTGESPVVIDAADLVATPDRLVAAYCARVGLPHLDRALHWTAGERPEWGVTRGWHREVSASSGIEQRRRVHPVRVDNDPRLAAMHRHHLPHYRRMYAARLTGRGD